MADFQERTEYGRHRIHVQNTLHKKENSRPKIKETV